MSCLKKIFASKIAAYGLVAIVLGVSLSACCHRSSNHFNFTEQGSSLNI